MHQYVFLLLSNYITLLDILGFPGGSLAKNLPANAGDTRDADSIPGLERFLGGGKWQPTPVFLPEKFHRPEKPGGLLCP